MMSVRQPVQLGQLFCCAQSLIIITHYSLLIDNTDTLDNIFFCVKILHFSHNMSKRLIDSALWRERCREGWREGWEMGLHGVTVTFDMCVGSGEWSMSCLPRKKWGDGKNVSHCATMFFRIGHTVRRLISHPSRHLSRHLSRLNALCFSELCRMWEKWRIFCVYYQWVMSN